MPERIGRPCVELRVLEGVLLTEYRAGDADALLLHLGSGEVGRTIPALPNPYRRASAERFLATRLRELEGERKPRMLAIRSEPARSEPVRSEPVHSEADSGLCGAIGLEAPSTEEPDWGELGYWLAPALWGRGIMGAALPIFLGYAAATLGVSLVTARALRGNRASLRLLETNGFRSLGVRPGAAGTAAAGMELAYFGLELEAASRPESGESGEPGECSEPGEPGECGESGESSA